MSAALESPSLRGTPTKTVWPRPGRRRSPTERDELGWIDFAGSNGHITIDVEVNGTPASAILDSGADASMISNRLAQRADVDLDLNERVRMFGIHGQREIPTSKRFTLAFAGRTVKLDNVPVAPGAGFDIVLGRSLFEWAVVQIDYPNHRLRFLNREAIEFEGNATMKTTRRGAPMIRSRVLGKKAWMLFDTGNSGATVLKRRFVRRHDLERYEIEGVTGASRGSTTAAQQHLLQIPGFELGPFKFETLLAAYNAEANEGFDGQRRLHGSRLRSDRVRYDGILGYEALRNFVVTMDLERDRIHLAVP